jgi:hypothetical protein
MVSGRSARPSAATFQVLAISRRPGAVMRTALLAILILLFAVDAADARRKRHRAYIVVVPPAGVMAHVHEPGLAYPNPRRGRRAPAMVGDVIPRHWQLAPPDPNWNGKRFVSPDGASWFAAYAAPADEATVSAHMKAVAFADDETITYLRGERTWIAVSGFKGSRIFYRKAVMACGGALWKYIAFEYPAELKREMDRFVIRAAQALDYDQTGCEAAVTSKRE